MARKEGLAPSTASGTQHARGKAMLKEGLGTEKEAGSSNLLGINGNVLDRAINSSGTQTEVETWNKCNHPPLRAGAGGREAARTPFSTHSLGCTPPPSPAACHRVSVSAKSLEPPGTSLTEGSPPSTALCAAAGSEQAWLASSSSCVCSSGSF